MSSAGGSYPSDFALATDALANVPWLSEPAFGPTGYFTKVRTLAEAIYGKVFYVAKNKDIPGGPVLPESLVVKAVLKSRITNLRGRVQECPQNEVCAFEHVRSNQLSGVVEFYGAWQDERHVYILTEYCSRGELFTLVAESGRYKTEADIRDVIKQMLMCVKSLHDAGIAHRDISLENFLVKEDWSITLIDLGQAIRVHAVGARVDEKMVMLDARGAPGKPSYLAAELMRYKLWPFLYSKEYSAKKLDVFAIGIALFVLIARTYPFNKDALYQAVGPNGYLFPDDDRDSARCQHVRSLLKQWEIQVNHISDDCLDLLELLLAPSMQKRPDVDQALAHPWLATGPAGLSEDSAVVASGSADSRRAVVRLPHEPAPTDASNRVVATISRPNSTFADQGRKTSNADNGLQLPLVESRVLGAPSAAVEASPKASYMGSPSARSKMAESSPKASGAESLSAGIGVAGTSPKASGSVRVSSLVQKEGVCSQPASRLSSRFSPEYDISMTIS